MPQPNISFKLYQGENNGLPFVAYDIAALADTATLEDYLLGLDLFMEQNLATCNGCHLCCHERAPLTALDIPPLLSLLPDGSFPVHRAAAAFAAAEVLADGAPDIFLRRPDDSCIFLHPQGFCRQHALRPLVCRSHFCLGKSQRALLLRSAIINQGEDELLRLLAAEEAAGAPPLFGFTLNLTDYPQNAFSGQKNPADILLKDICGSDIWAKLKG